MKSESMIFTEQRKIVSRQRQEKLSSGLRVTQNPSINNVLLFIIYIFIQMHANILRGMC